MDLHEKIRTLPTSAGVYLYKNAEAQVIYVGKAKNLRARVRSYFVEAASENAKTGTLLREAVDLDYIVVDNEREALALENNLIKQKKPRYNILLRDDKTYPYIKLTMGERHPRVYVTRRLRKDGSLYFGPYFPTSLAYRLVDLIHRHFLIPSCKLDLNRYYPRPCLQYYIGRCLGPCVKDLTTPQRYAEAVHDVKLFLDGRGADLSRSLHERMGAAAERQQFELAAKYRDLISTVELQESKQRMHAVDGDDADVFGYHYENQMLAVNLFHMRGGKIMDKREFFWEDMQEIVGEKGFDPGEFFSALLKQVYLDQQYIPHNVYVPVEFEDRAMLEEVLSDAQERKIQIHVPQRGEKRSLVDLVGQNAKQVYDQRFRVMKPAAKVIQEALQDALTLPELPRRIECFDISHIQGAETVASMVVWEDGRMKKPDYRKFIIKSVVGVDDFASMREVVTRRYSRLQAEEKPLPSLILIDGGIGQLHAAADALEALGIVNQPLASIAKREEIIYVHGQEDDPIMLDRHSPVLHLVQLVRDEAHRFAVTFHRKRREIRDRKTELLEVPGVGAETTRRLLQHFGSLEAVKEADAAALASVVSRPQAEAILQHFHARTTSKGAAPDID
ncbi:MAG TPA: excinuclease ABC subunit UvrC [Candidatus Eisenbacteria bacterium]|nr:excinuclease ABC subunit UvrC [Candidatus Eisenbacteria bacterium]